MPRRFPLQPLHDLATDRVDSATRDLARLKQHWQMQEEKMNQLISFQNEYRQRLANGIAQGMDMTLMRDFHKFLHKLELAIRHQKVEIEHAKHRWEDSQRQWLEERRKLKTYEVLKDRHQRRETYREGRLEQRDMDEHARNGLTRRRGLEGKD